MLKKSILYKIIRHYLVQLISWHDYNVKSIIDRLVFATKWKLLDWFPIIISSQYSSQQIYIIHIKSQTDSKYHETCRLRVREEHGWNIVTHIIM